MDKPSLPERMSGGFTPHRFADVDISHVHAALQSAADVQHDFEVWNLWLPITAGLVVRLCPAIDEHENKDLCGPLDARLDGLVAEMAAAYGVAFSSILEDAQKALLEALATGKELPVVDGEACDESPAPYTSHRASSYTHLVAPGNLGCPSKQQVGGHSSEFVDSRVEALPAEERGKQDLRSFLASLPDPALASPPGHFQPGYRLSGKGGTHLSIHLSHLDELDSLLDASVGAPDPGHQSAPTEISHWSALFKQREEAVKAEIKAIEEKKQKEAERKRAQPKEKQAASRLRKGKSLAALSSAARAGGVGGHKRAREPHAQAPAPSGAEDPSVAKREQFLANIMAEATHISGADAAVLRRFVMDRKNAPADAPSGATDLKYTILLSMEETSDGEGAAMQVKRLMELSFDGSGKYVRRKRTRKVDEETAASLHRGEE